MPAGRLNKRGLVHENDVKVLNEWNKLIQKAFADNLLKGARIESANGKNLKALLDDDTDTHFTTKQKDSTSIITFLLPAVQIFDVLLLQENISKGQRIEKFVLEYEHDGAWKTITEGTTVGHKRLLKFEPVKAQKIRLRIESSRLKPHIAETGIYKLPELK